MNVVPRIGTDAPSFKNVPCCLPDKTLSTISLSDYINKWLVIVFYPLNFTFVCPTELIAISNIVDKLKSLNCEVIGISVDSEYSHLAWMNTPRKEGGIDGIKFPLLSDVNKLISQSYGALHLDSGHPLRALYIIDDKQKIRHITMNDPPVGRSSDEIIRLIEAFKHHEETGDVCPSDWNKDSLSIKPDPVLSKDYFSSMDSKMVIE